MHLVELKEMVDSTRDAAFAVDSDGLVVAWNQPCEALIGVPATRALGQRCWTLLHGVDESGPVCTKNCCVLGAAAERHPLGNFDLLVKTPAGTTWCNISILLATERSAAGSWSVHVVREIDLRKRLEVLVRDFVVASTNLPDEQKSRLRTLSRSPRQVSLTPQETAVLRLLSKGSPTGDVAAALSISGTTVNNHVQHLMRKLGAHTRLEAIRRAEAAGLL